MEYKSAFLNKKMPAALLPAFGLVFFILISLPLVFSLIKTDLEKTSENRLLTQWSDVTSQGWHWASLPNRLEHYWNDQHAFREELNNFYSTIRYKAGIISSSNLYWFAGKDGWLFEYRHEYPLSREQLDSWKAYFESRGDISRAHGSQYIAMFAPQKRSIYPEKFGGAGEKKQFWHSQLSTYLSDTSPESILDIREQLISKKRLHNVYHKIDIHWNLHGANYAHMALMNEIFRLTNDTFYQARYYDDSWFTLKEAKENGLAKAFNLQSQLKEMQPWFSDASRFCTKLSIAPLNNNSQINFSDKIINIWDFRTSCPQGKGRALVFRDSFSNLLWVFLSEYFQEVIYISRPFPAHSNNEFSLLVEQYKPDIVIEEIAERYIPRGP